MSEAKHTPGPWEAVEIGQGGPADAPMPIYQIHGGSDRAMVAEFVDGWNAHLIAAAPDLLEALRMFRQATNTLQLAQQDGINVHGALSGFLGARDVADAAIAKALGEPSHG